MATGGGAKAEAALREPGRELRGKAASGSGWYAWLARGGLAAKGASYGLVGALAIGVALEAGGKATSRQGALESLAGHALGKFALALLAVGFAAYATWRFVQAFVERESDEDEAKGQAKKWGKRAAYAGRGVVYSGLTFSALKILLGSRGGQSQNQKAHRTTATVLDWPGGRWLVGAAGVALVGVALWNAYRGLGRKFEDRWRVGEMGRVERTWGGRAGVAGHLARAVVFALIGVFLTRAAIEYDPNEAIGLDGALQKLAAQGYGPYLLGITAAGLVCYGLYCLVDARYRDVSTGGGGGARETASRRVAPAVR